MSVAPVQGQADDTCEGNEGLACASLTSAALLQRGSSGAEVQKMNRSNTWFSGHYEMKGPPGSGFKMTADFCSHDTARRLFAWHLPGGGHYGLRSQRHMKVLDVDWERATFGRGLLMDVDVVPIGNDQVFATAEGVDHVMRMVNGETGCSSIMTAHGKLPTDKWIDVPDTCASLSLGHQTGCKTWHIKVLAVDKHVPGASETGMYMSDDCAGKCSSSGRCSSPGQGTLSDWKQTNYIAQKSAKADEHACSH